MWIAHAFLSAFFAGITAVLAKVGLEKIPSSLATALRTIVVLLFAWAMVCLKRGQGLLVLVPITNQSLLFLVLSGISTGASWLCYFKALQTGPLNKVVPIDKSSTLLTMVLSFVFLKEPFTLLTIVSLCLIGFGTYIMVKSPALIPQGQQKPLGLWLWYALASALFASLTAILSKIGIKQVDAALGTAIRTSMVLVMAWLMVFIEKSQRAIKAVSKKNWGFLILSGLSTGFSWLFYNSALQTGPASVVVPIDKLSILVTLLFAYIVYKERLTSKAFVGLFCLVGGTLLLLL